MIKFIFIFLCFFISSVASAYASDISSEINIEPDIASETEPFFEPFYHEMKWNFYVYDVPSLMSEKSGRISPQPVLVMETRDDGFARISTYMGEKWIYMPQNKYFYDKWFYIYEEMNLSGKSELMPPQIVEISEETEDGWASVMTYKGIRQMYYPYVHTRLNMEAPVFYQMNKHINGCESYAATSALNALGLKITPDEFIERVPQNITKYSVKNGVSIWGDPDEEFVGSMSATGFATYPAVIVKVINENFSDAVFAENITGAGYEDITSYITKGGIVLIWYHPSGNLVRKPRTWYTPEGKRIDADFGTHTVAITGFDRSKGTVFVCDSIDGKKKELSWRTIASTYDGIGRKSVYINKTIYLMDCGETAYDNKD